MIFFNGFFIVAKTLQELTFKNNYTEKYSLK